jgi:hypothetical protein
MPEFTSYPYTFSANASAAEYWNADGFRLTITANTFAQATSITISAPIKKAFYLRSLSTNLYTISGGNYYKLTRNSGVAPSKAFKVTVPYKPRFEQDKNLTLFTVYYCDQATVEEDDPGNWHPGTNKTIPTGTGLVAAETTAFGYFMVGHQVDGRTDF